MKFSGKLIHQKITWILFTKVQSYMSLLCFTRHISDFFYNFCLLSGKTPQRLTKYHITYRSDRNTLLYTLTELQAFGLLSSHPLGFLATKLQTHGQKSVDIFGIKQIFQIQKGNVLFWQRISYKKYCCFILKTRMNNKVDRWTKNCRHFWNKVDRWTKNQTFLE